MLVSRRPSVGPIRVRQLQFFGADPNITELRGLVALPEWRAAAYRALVEHALAHTDDWDSLMLSGITPEVELGAVERSADFNWLYQITDHELQLPDSWEAFRGKLPRNIKESLRKCYNSLKRDELDFRLEVAETPQQVVPALTRFFELHAARAGVADTVHHWDVFRAPEAQRFMIHVCHRFAERGCLRIFQLVIGGEVVAARVGLIAGGALYLYYSGYDPAFAKYSVMTTTVAEAIRYAIEHGFGRVNLSTGSDVSKTRWGPSSRVTRAAMLHSPSVRSKLTHRVYQHALSAIGTSSALRRATTFLTRRSLPPAAI
jgi:CelD/BcsL family acetyltransferase involved in cellulose biosynthesis